MGAATRAMRARASQAVYGVACATEGELSVHPPP